MTMLHYEAPTELPVSCTSVTIPAQAESRGMSRVRHSARPAVPHMFKAEMVTELRGAQDCLEANESRQLLGEGNQLGFQQSCVWMGHWGEQERAALAVPQCSGMAWEN